MDEPRSLHSSEGVPQLAAVREQLRRAAVQQVQSEGLTPPLTLAALTDHAAEVVATVGAEASCVPFATVLVSNALWQSVVASVPFDRRVLMLPQCLRDRASCPAPSDEFGLLCAGCGTCSIHDLQREAEALGYLVVVAEGTMLVRELLREGTVDAVIGVSCLESLAKSFPSMAAEAVPGLAIPLLNDGCEQTAVDLTWLREVMSTRVPGDWSPDLRLERLRAEVSGWFTESELRPLLCREGTSAEQVACEWLARDGKRWRPSLSTACARSLLPAEKLVMHRVRRVAVAVECFHKAALAHDDIEDNDDYRYGRAALHGEHGIPVALNAGDLLIGCGYRLLAELDLPPERVVAMIRLAADGHERLCLGQGEELDWVRAPYPITVEKTLAIFRRKTSPAFEVGLRMGAMLAGADDELGDILHRFCDALGTAYQIRDDIQDFGCDQNLSADLEPSLFLALAFEQAAAAERVELEQALHRPIEPRRRRAMLARMAATLNLRERADRMYAEARERAFRELDPLAHASLKRLLHRIASRILP